MKRLLLCIVCLIAMTAAGTGLKAQEVTVTLIPGWTWISCPSTEAVDFATALGDFTPQIGDIIKSQWGSATYKSNGQWRGNISQFSPGYGYHYYSNRTTPVMLTFNAQQPAPQVLVTTLEPTNITMISAICGGNVASSNGDFVSVTLRGICWSTNPNPTFNDNYIEAGNGLGSFTVSMIELTPSTTYYLRAFAVTPTETIYGEEMNFTTIDEPDYVDLGLPSGTLWAICNVGSDSPEQYGDYFAWGETQPKNFYYWSTYQYCNGNWDQLTKYCNNPNQGYNGFTDNIITLQFSDDAAMANWGNNWRMPTLEEWQELYNSTTHIWTTQNGVNGYLFTASNGNSLFLPAAGYRDTSGLYDTGSYGSYWSSSLCTNYPSRATCVFYNSDHLNMINNERCRGMSIRPVRSATQNPPLIINATANPAEGGVVSGGGSYQAGAECTLTATANEGYTFTSWTENDEVVSTEATYTFTVNASQTLVANFTPLVSWPNGILPGVFSISATQQIQFSQGNLQFMASTNTWCFAENQYDHIGNDNCNISSTYSGWIDLFGWGTSGYHDNSDIYNTNYYPYSTSASLVNRTFNYFGYGPSINMPSNNLNGTSASYDWGVYNPINNGGNTANNWRILTQSEWNYLFNTRNTVSGIRYAQARVNGINGILLLPDNWSSDIYSLNNTNNNGASFSNNEINDTDWTILENAGVVFLPASGNRYETSVSGVGSLGCYWSASYCTNNCVNASSLQFGNSYANTNYDNDRCRGLSVRLVRNVE